MKVKYGNGKTEYGPGVEIKLDGDEVASAIDEYLVANDVVVRGPRTIRVNGELCQDGWVYVDPSGFVINDGVKLSGRGMATCDEVDSTKEPPKPVVNSDKKILCLIYDTDNGKAVSFANTTTVDDEHEIVEAITVYDDGGKYPVGSVLKYDDFINGLANHRQNSYVGHTEVETSTYHSYLKDINEAKKLSVGDVLLMTHEDAYRDQFYALVVGVSSTLEFVCLTENRVTGIGETEECFYPTSVDYSWSLSSGKELGEHIDSYSKKAKAIRSIDENEIPF